MMRCSENTLIGRSRGRRGRVLLLAAAAVAGWSCGGEPTSAAPDTRVATLTLSDSVLAVQTGFFHQLRAEPRSSEGASLKGISVAWSTDHPELALVDANGLVSGLAPGVAHISATAAGLQATAAVTVIPAAVVSVALNRTSALLSPGRKLRVIATPLDSLGRSVPGRTLTFTSSDTVVAQVAADGSVTAGAVGTAKVAASADGATAALTVSVVAATAVDIGVSGVAAAGNLGSSGFALILSTGDDSLVVADSGGAARLSGALALPDTVWFRARADSDAFAPSGLKALSGALPASVPVIFIPHAIDVASGPFAGQSVAVPVSAAFVPCDIPGTQCPVNSGFYPSGFQSGVAAWETLPVPVEIVGFADSDTTLIWSALRLMEDAVGHRLFAPANGQNSGITVTVGPTSTTWTTDARGRITSAHVWLAAPQGHAVPHEFLHALGFGHTCSWPSVMGGYGCGVTSELSAGDVAYYLLARAVFDAETPLRLPDGTLPCGTMGMWAAAEPSDNFPYCGTDASASATARGLVSTPRGSRATPQAASRVYSMP